MNTKTMRLPPRRVLTPTKRKERVDLDAPKQFATKSLKQTTFQAGSEKGKAADSEPDLSNQLLAGYLAHEYLTQGTLFGQPFESKVKPERTEEEEEAEPSEDGKYQRYVEVASLLKTDGAQLPGIVNPTQLGRFLHM